MARIVYALSGQGRGHTSRVIAVSDALRRRGHEVRFCCGGTAREILEAEGEDVIPVPALRQQLVGNEVQLGATIRSNWLTVTQAPWIVKNLAERLDAVDPDLLVTDFEAFAPRAAQKIGVPVVSFNHQQVVTETEYEPPPGCTFHAFVTRMVIDVIAPRDPAHVLLSSFFFPPLKRPARTTLVPPIIRPAVQALTPTDGDYVLVYYNQTEGAAGVLEALRAVPVPFVVYNFPEPEAPEQYPNLTFKQPSLETFLEDLAGCRAVLCTAGFTLISEGLFLGKPLLVVPNRGIFEQTLNAVFLEREGLGQAVINRPLTAADVAGFLMERDRFAGRLRGRPAIGNDAAVACLERVLQQRRPVVALRPTPALAGRAD